ncbi:hypothetical protein [Candidatus Chloroploca asiatica]|uniref:Uncharacterized protein n=1 Tax=Candidatus Chloroploca asiatica TaxID=1506545 RepID=A0A2H3L760_9CHLR|nr:hypothetical protein [Candidatus Chloroploca asiatica]PDV99083.1 hypothetical protein A9Q02_13445 [Candidatus Chloroploca asiatica]
MPLKQRHGTVALIAKPGGPHTGVGRYVQMLQSGLEAEEYMWPVWPLRHHRCRQWRTLPYSV